MRLKLTTNLGIVDARKIDLTPEKAKAGTVINVTDERIAQEFVSRGWAVEPGHKAGAGVAPPTSADFDDTPGGVLIRDAVTGTDEGEDDDAGLSDADFDGMTKEELKAYADDHDIAGVTMAMAKDDMLKTVKKGARSR